MRRLIVGFVNLGKFASVGVRRGVRGRESSYVEIAGVANRGKDILPACDRFVQGDPGVSDGGRADSYAGERGERVSDRPAAVVAVHSSN